MKTDFLKGLGLTDEQVSSIMAENGKDINSIKTERDTYKGQLDTANATLDTFKSVDVGGLQSKITQLTSDLEKKDTEIAGKLAEIEFNSSLEKAIGGYKPRNINTVLPLLDTTKLRESKNQEQDIKAAIEAIKTENPFLFNDVKVPYVVSSTQGIDNNVANERQQANEAFRALLGKGE